MVGLTVLVQHAQAADPYYNIMTMDGGGIRGIITASCINKIEIEAYKYAKDQPYFKNVPEIYDDETGERIEKIHMQWLYSMFSGTSTGSLLSGAMAVFNETGNAKDNLKGFKRPQYWGADATDIYEKTSPLIFRYNGLASVIKVLYYMAIIAFISGVSYLIGNRCYFRKKKIDAFERVERFLLETKERLMIENKLKETILMKMAKDLKEIKTEANIINVS